MREDNNIYEQIILNGASENIVIKLDKEFIETNENKCLLDDTIDLNGIVKEINENE